MVDDGSDSDIDVQTFTSDELRERRLVESLVARHLPSAVATSQSC